MNGINKGNGDDEMNKWNRLLNALDLLFGFTDKKKSTFRKVGHTFDERTNEYVITIEYRVRRGGDGVVSNRSGGRLIDTILRTKHKKVK